MGIDPAFFQDPAFNVRARAHGRLDWLLDKGDPKVAEALIIVIATLYAAKTGPFLQERLKEPLEALSKASGALNPPTTTAR